MRREEIKLLKILRVVSDLYPSVVCGIGLHADDSKMERISFITIVARSSWDYRDRCGEVW